MWIDIHGHLGKWMFPAPEVTPSTLIARMHELSIEKIIVSSTKALLYDFREGNCDIEKIATKYPEIFGYITVNLNYLHESIREIDCYKDHPRFLGVKIHPMIQRRAVDSYNGCKIIEKAASCGLPVLIHSHSSHDLESPRHTATLLQSFPDVRIIMAHAGGEDWETALEIALQYPQVYVDLSSSNTTPEKVRAFVSAIGSHRILFGSDTTLFDPSYAMGNIQDSKLDTESFDRITYKNATEVFNFPV